MQNFIENYPPGVVVGDSVGVEVDGTFGVVVPDEVDAPDGDGDSDGIGEPF